MTIENAAPVADRLPVGGLLALAMAGFITLMTEVMPAGLLPHISAGLKIDESMAGQLVTAYAAVADLSEGCCSPSSEHGL
ncbi:MFS transporter [Neorhizobium sp. JUb45]|uniref:MFS transporter n=1 Tax=unclassified Neorhizobium TaxID=2629175 RepID=UPI0010EA5EFD|nr:MFS transporter [Neorhizobium sp. JUb45]TCQ99984.1 hypothetical protein EDF70_10762 [Neorhizobium sp. JUb45]